MKKRLFSILTALALCLSLLPATALAATQSDVTYYDWSESEKALVQKTCASATEVTSSETAVTWNTGWYVVQGPDPITINGLVTVSGDVHLILADNCTLTVNGGINVSSGNSLTIYGQSTPSVDEEGNVNGNTGKLTATGGGYQAGIGGSENQAGGKITINGGVITANGGSSTSGCYGAGIGGGGSNISSTGSEITINGGEITINGGVVNATGGDGTGVSGKTAGGAGIGGGGNGNSNGWGPGIPGGRITITGGTVKATAGRRGAGIGGGGSYYGNGGSGGTITISGGTVTADGGTYGAGIDGGKKGGGGTVTISGGTVTAIGSYGSGIGGGYEGGSGTVTISGGEINATSTKAAGIGGTFTTASPGNAIIKASRIDDTSAQGSWSGIIFDGSNGGVYGTQTLSSAFTVETGETLLIAEGATLTTNSQLTNNGTIYVDGTLSGDVGGNVYYPLTLTNCTASGDTSNYNSNLYAKAGASVTLTPGSAPAGKVFDHWTSTSNDVTFEGNSFTMPAKAVTVTANFANALNITAQPQSASITYGETAELSVAAKLYTSLSGDLSYQWYQKEGATEPDKALDNETNNTLSLSNLTAGTYTYYCVITCGSYTVTSDTATVTVGKAAPELTAPTANTLVYDGTAQTLVAAGTATGGTMQYSLNNADWSDAIPTGKNADTYTVWYKVVGDGNHNDSTPASVDVTIAKKEVTVEPGTYKVSKPYDGTTAAGTTAGALSVTGILPADSGVTVQATPVDYSSNGVGVQTSMNVNIALTGTGSENYKIKDNATTVTVPCEITARPITIHTATATNRDYIEGNTSVEADVTFTGAIGTLDKGTDYTVTGKMNDANAGAGKTVNVTVTLTGTAATNYTLGNNTTTATVTINPAALGAAVTLDDWTYGDTPKDPVVTGNTENGEVTYLYKVWSADDQAYSEAVPTEAGNYTVKATIGATANYQQAVVSDNFTIKPKTLTVTGLTATNRVYDGTKDVTLTGGTLSGIVAGDENLVSATMPTSGTVSDANAGDNKSVIYATILLTGGKSENYALSQPAVTVNIEPLGVDEPTVTGTYTYDRTQKTVTLGGFDDSYMTVTGNTGTNAGAYTATVTLDGNHKWNEGSDGSIQWTIARKPVTATVTVTTKTYDGDTDATVSAEVTTTGGLIDGDSIIIEGLTGTFDNANAGTDKKVIVNAENKSITGNDASNYNVTIPDEAKGAITPKTIGIDWTDTATLTYNGTPQKPTATATELEDGDTCTITVTGEQTNAGNHTATATALDNGNYQLPDENTTTFSIARKEVTATPKDVTITRGNAIPAFELTYTGLLGEDTLTPNSDPAFTCYEKDGTTPVSTGTAAGTYTITWTNTDIFSGEANNNYRVVAATGTLTINNPSYSNTTTTTEKNEDGSTTTTVTDKTTGTVTETTKNTDGSTTVVETKKDGTVTETNKSADGTTGTVVTDSSGEVTEVKASVSSAAVTEAAKTGETVTLPVEVPAAKTTGDAPAVEVTVPKSAEEVKVEIPVEDVTPGTVAVIVHADGTEEIVKTSTPTETGVALTLGGSATVKIVDNAKVFEDIHPVNHWAKDAVDFVVARGMFSGTSETTFGSNSNMTRAMLMTVLARFDGVDTSGGSVWYEKGMEWAKANGVSDGSNPNGNITREQLATMLWRYAGSPASSHSLDGYTDADEISGYALEAMRWANENGIINGYGNGLLGGKDNAARTQVAQMLMNFVTSLNQ